MNLGCKLFLLAVEEMNFTKAASRAFVTQQCLSSHIKKLEEEYNVKIFERTPNLRLTPAGQSLYHSLCQIQIAEKAMIEKLTGIKDGLRGKIIFGINTTRARIILPDLFAEYYQHFPLVKISIVLADIENLVPKLLSGKLDVLLGIDCISNSDFNVLPLGQDEVFFIATEAILQKFAATPAAYEQTISSSEIDLVNFPGVPFAGNYDGSTFNTLVKRYLDSRNIHQEIVFSISDYETQIALCSRDQLVLFCPKTILEKVIEHNKKISPDKPLRIFKLCGMKDSLRIELITHKNAYQPLFAKEFIRLLQDHINKNDRLIAEYTGFQSSDKK